MITRRGSRAKLCKTATRILQAQLSLVSLVPSPPRSSSRSLVPNLALALRHDRSFLASHARHLSKVAPSPSPQQHGRSPTPPSIRTPPLFFLLVFLSAGVVGEGDRIFHSFASFIQFQSHGTPLLDQELSVLRVLGPTTVP